VPGPGAENTITDIEGLAVGNAHDDAVQSGVTVVLPDRPAVAAVDVRGGGPGTRDTEALDPACLVERVDAICLAGGSVFGLDAAGGVVSRLAALGRGVPIREFRVPIVPSAIIFDLVNGGDKDWGDEPPYRRLGGEAFDNASRRFCLGRAGAGYGAMAGRIRGGLGSASMIDGDVQVGALVVANPVGAVTLPGEDVYWAWPFEQDAEFGGRAPSGRPLMDVAEIPGESRLGANTTLAVVATNVTLDKAQAKRVAIMAHDGLARAIRPLHTAFDGDTVFALSTCACPMPEEAPLTVSRIGMMAADCLSRAVARAVYEAARG